MTQPIYVIGHRNPDTDSIAAALGYAELKRQLGENAVAARCGQPNPETQFALDHFQVEAPVLMADMRPRVRDVMRAPEASAPPETVFYQAARLMRDHNLKMLPISDGEGKLAGIVSVADLAEKYASDPGQNVLAALTPVANLLTALEGRLLAGDAEGRLRGKVVAAAMHPETMTRYIAAGDVVLVGDRPDAQEAALQVGAACLVVTGGLPVEPHVLALAKSCGAAVISADLDTFTAARRVEMSVAVGQVMRREVVAFHAGDLIAEAKQVAVETKHRNYPVVDDEGRLVGLVGRADLADVPRKRIILVDHNAREEAVPGIEEAEVLEIIDHHRLADLQTAGPIYFRLEPVGSSSTIVTSMFLERGLKPSRGVAGVLLSAILSDTLLFKSPTCTPRDQAMAEVLWEIAGVDWRQYGMALLKAGSSLKDKTARELLTLDYKIFRLEGRRIGVGQINTLDLEETLGRKAEILGEMGHLMETDSLDAVMLMVTDPIQEGSEVLFTGDPRLIEAAFGRLEARGSLFVPGMVSRKKQMIPLLSNALLKTAGVA